MGTLPSFNPSSIAQAGTGLVFYLLVAASLVFSISTIYSLIKYSKSRGLGFGISVVYLIVYISLVAQGIGLLNSIK